MGVPGLGPSPEDPAFPSRAGRVAPEDRSTSRPQQPGGASVSTWRDEERSGDGEERTRSLREAEEEGTQNQHCQEAWFYLSLP